MIRLGVVAAGPAVRIADGTQASAGDLILCIRNDHTVHATEPGRMLVPERDPDNYLLPHSETWSDPR
jgi:hypothetical protein